ncbi:unnamed protein product [Brassica napus]|uniref:(rape) hypothetical protein n=1 Tax=Brassica napus TaxID=3708 RepID=A0A816VY32_BRANA|nr:unnamed protein product [Brassica napus]
MEPIVAQWRSLFDQVRLTGLDQRTLRRKHLGVKNELSNYSDGSALINGARVDGEMHAATGSLPPIECFLCDLCHRHSEKWSKDYYKRVIYVA